MPSTVEAKIYYALCYHLSGLVFSPAIMVAYPNVDFTPPDATYLEVIYFPNVTNTRFLAGGTFEHIGIFQVSVWYKKGEGATDPLDIAGQIVTHFQQNTDIERNEISVKIDTQPYLSAPVQEGDRLQLPVTIRYRCNAGA